MSKVLIVSDLHIHNHKKSIERLEHCLQVLEWVFQTALAHKIKNILFLGDLFHDRQKIDILNYQKTFMVFEKYLKNKPFNIYLLLGNHDLWHLEKWDISSVFPLRNIPGVNIVSEPCTLSIENIDISFLPYTADPITDLVAIENNSNYKILCGHVAIDGALFANGIHAEVSVEHDGELVKVGKEAFTGWDQVFLGHYHAEQKLNDNIEYVGSPLQLSFGEAFQKKHIIIYDLETHKKEYILNTFSPQHFILHEKDLTKYDLKNNFVRVIVDDMGSGDLIEMRHTLVSEEKVGSIEFKQAEKPQNETIVEDAKAILYSGDEMLKRYTEQQNIGELNKEHLLEIGKNICNNYESILKEEN